MAKRESRSRKDIEMSLSKRGVWSKLTRPTATALRWCERHGTFDGRTCPQCGMRGVKI